MSGKKDANEIKSETEREESFEEENNKEKPPIERRVIKKIILIQKETEELKKESPAENDLIKEEPVEAEQNVKKEKKPIKKKRRWPLVFLLVLLLLGGILWYALPYIRIYTGNYLYNIGKYENAIALVQEMRENEEAGHIIDDCAHKIAERTAEQILNNDKELKEYGLKLDEVYEYQNSLDYKNKNELTSFVAEYKNDHFTYRGSYTANIVRKDDGSWIVTAYSKKGNEIIPVKKPSKVLAGSLITEEYPEARYKETKQVSESEVIYVFEMFSWERPLYKTGYEISTRCSYDIESDSWKADQIQKELKDSEEIPLKTFVNSIFTIDLPESWIITRNEEIETKKTKTVEYTDYNYIYTFFSDLERDRELMKISVNFSSENKNSSNNGKSTISGKNIGTGIYTESSNTYSLSFQPKIRKMNSSFVISGYGISREELQKIVDSIVIVDHHYKLTIIPEGVFNIRDGYSSKTGKVLSTAKQGDTFTASRAVFNEGYTWFDVATGKWIADKDGEWLLVE